MPEPGPLRTRLTELLGVRYPIVQTGMGWVATPQLVAAGILMACGVWLHLTERHVHQHKHEALDHEHEHVHDVHHQHAHPYPVAPGTRHTHPHHHDAMTHTHPHFPDAHHRHDH